MKLLLTSDSALLNTSVFVLIFFVSYITEEKVDINDLLYHSFYFELTAQVRCFYKCFILWALVHFLNQLVKLPSWLYLLAKFSFFYIYVYSLCYLVHYSIPLKAKFNYLSFEGLSALLKMASILKTGHPWLLQGDIKR